MVRRGQLPVLVAGLLGVGLLVMVRNTEPARPLGEVLPHAAPYAPAAVPAPPTRPAAPARTPGDLPVVDPAWASATAARTGVPITAMTAYARATLRAPAGCHLGWTTLAGVGWIESQHGTLGERILGLDGVASTPILGPALDGAGDVAAIAATPRGTALHGDPRWDHALGPMQFITDTWRRWGADGDGDGRRDPQDLDDAAWSAARYLCAGGRDLGDGPGWSAGILSYNRSQAYLDAVYATASTYAVRASR